MTLKRLKEGKGRENIFIILYGIGRCVKLLRLEFMELFRNFKYGGEIHRYPDLIWITGTHWSRQNALNPLKFGRVAGTPVRGAANVPEKNHLAFH